MSKVAERREHIEQLHRLRRQLQSWVGLSNRFRDELIMAQVAKIDAEIARIEGRKGRKREAR
jgi:hypothetical protein